MIARLPELYRQVRDLAAQVARFTGAPQADASPAGPERENAGE
jgi:hypothetical protein